MGGKVQGGPVQYNRCGNDPIYLLPEYKYNLFTAQNHSRAIYLRERGGADHEKAEDGTVPSFVPLNAQGRHEGSPQKMMKRDFIIFPAVDGRYNIVPDKTSGKKDITLCFLNNLGNSKYEYYLKADRGGKKPEINCAFIVIEVCENKSGKKAEFEYTPLGRGLPVKTEKIEIRKDELDEMYMFKFKINVYDDNPGNGAGNKTPERYKYEGEKTIRIRAGMKEESGNIIWSPASGITMMFCPCAGWTLAEGGQMVQGATGYLIDENGYYILEDGRRVSDEIIIAGSYGEKDIRIGDKDVSKGLSEIMGTRNILPAKTVYNDVYEELFKSSQSAMPLVAYQAFQINACYAKPNGIQNPLAIGSNAKFYSIGTDETDIPIVVTQVGEDGPGKKKLVIAGPHGDERNAQRLIMAVQKHFIDKNLPADTVLYFIPCLSPTMCFADVRGITNEFWDGGNQGTNRPFTLKKNISIPELHEKIKNNERGNIQRQIHPLNPRYGIDANRDVYFSFESSKKFADFIKSITRADVRAGTGRDDGRCTVFMMHGYDSTKANDRNQGCVYGQYTIDTDWIGTIPPIIRSYVDYITQSLFGYKIIVPAGRDFNEMYFYNDLSRKNIRDVSSFNGEWAQHLYGRNGERSILSFDIELGEIYREGERGAVLDGRIYNHNRIEDKSLPFFDLNQQGFFVPGNLRITEQNIRDDATRKDDEPKREYATTSFFEFLKCFYDKKQEIDANSVQKDRNR